MNPKTGSNQDRTFDPDQWAAIVVERWEEKIMQLGIIGDQLINSFTHHVISESAGDHMLIQFAFNYYGKFVDMGVGKGVPLEEVQFSNRRAKPWYSKAFGREIKKMAELLSEHYGYKIAIGIADSIQNR